MWWSLPSTQRFLSSNAMEKGNFKNQEKRGGLDSLGLKSSYNYHFIQERVKNIILRLCNNGLKLYILKLALFAKGISWARAAMRKVNLVRGKHGPTRVLFYDLPFPVPPSRWFRKWLRSCCACISGLEHNIILTCKL